MSDVSPGQLGGVQVSQVMVGVGADFSGLDQAASSAGQRFTDLANRSTESGNKVGSAFGVTAASGVSKLSGQITALNALSGGDSALRPLVGVVQGLNLGLSTIGDKARTGAAGLDRMVNTGRGLTAVGIAITGIGFALSLLGAPLTKAQGNLKSAVESTTNTATGQANTWKDWSAQMDAATKAGERYGFTQADTAQALARLTVASKDPEKGLRDLNVAMTASVAGNKSLASSADGIARSYGGMFRWFKQFGIDLPNIRLEADGVTKAQDKLKTATDNLSKAQQSLADFDARVKDQMSQAQERWARTVQNAQDRAGASQSKYDDLASKVAQDQIDLNERYADEVERANQKVGDSYLKLSELQSRLAARRKDEEAAHAEGVENAKNSVDDARRNLQQIEQRQAVSPASDTAGRLQQQNELKNARDRLTTATEKLHDAENKGLQSNEQQVATAQELEHATTEVSKAESDRSEVLDKQATLSRKLAQEQSQLAAAGASNARAQRDLQAALEGQARAGGLSITQQQERRKLEEAIVVDKGKVKDAQDKVNDSQSKLAQIFQRVADAEADFNSRHKTVLKNYSDSWAGHFAKLKAEAVDALAHIGQHSSGIMAVGAGLYVMGSAVRGIAGLKGALMGAAEGEGAIELASSPLLGVAALIIGIGAAGLLIYENWDSVVSGLSTAWDWLKGAASGVVDWFANHFGDKFFTIMTGGLNKAIIFIYDHMGAVFNFFADIGGKIWKVVSSIGSDLFNIGWNIVMGLWNGIASAWDKFIGWFEDQIKKGFIGKTLGWLFSHSPSMVFHGIGVNVVKGLQLGISDSMSLLDQAHADMQKSLLKPFKFSSLQAETGGSTAFGASSNSANRGFPASGGPRITVINNNFNNNVKGSQVVDREFKQGVRNFLVNNGTANGGSSRYINPVGS